MKLSSLAVQAGAAYNHPDKFFIRRSDDYVLISERGTATIEDFIKDALFLKTDFLGHRAHQGFVDRFNEVWPAVKAALHPTDEVYVTGHSLGGAVATLIAWKIKREFGILCKGATFGSPGVFDHEGAEAFNREVTGITRVVHKLDLVPRIPKLDYWQVDKELHLDDDGVVLLPDQHWFRRLFKVFMADADGLSLDNHHMPTYLQAVFAYEDLYGK